MRSRAFRRSATAVGVYLAAALGFLGTVLAARLLGPGPFGLFALVFAAATFVQVLLDATVDEAAIKYGLRYAEREEWGRLRRLFRVALEVKLAGAAAAAVALAAFAPFADEAFGDAGLLTPLLVAAALPLAQAPDSIAGAALVVRGRYDVRAHLLALTMALRLAGLAVGALFGVTEAVAGIVAGQLVASAVAAVVAIVAFGRFPDAAAGALAEDARPLARFVGQSALASAFVSARTTLPALALGVVAPPTQVGYFRAAQAPQTGFAALSAPARLVLLAEQTRDVERGRLDRVWRLLRRYVLGTAVIAAIAAPVLWWSMPELVRVLYGSDYAGAVDAMRVIVVAAVIQLVFAWTKSFPVSIGRPGLRIVAHAVEVAVLAPLVVVLGARWEATGAAVASLVATVVFSAFWVLLLVRLRREHPAGVGVGGPTREAVAR